MSIENCYIKEVATVTAEASLQEAIDMMLSFQVNDVIVVENRNGKSYPIGFLTNHDIVTKVYSDRIDQGEVFAKDIMSRNPITCTKDQGFYETMDLMQKNKVKRIPVVDNDGSLLGIVTASDLIDVLSEEHSVLSKHLGEIATNH